MNPHVCYVILNYNEWETTQACISSLEQSQHKNIQIIIIDNHSSSSPPDLTFNTMFPLFDNEYHEENFTKKPQINQPIYSILSGINGGFPYGVNIGLKLIKYHITTDYIWLLNNDTICNESTLSHLIDQANPMGIIGSTLVDKNQRPLRSLCRIHPILGLSSKTDKIDSQTYIPFTSALIGKQALETIGHLNDDYFLYYDDADYCHTAIKNNISLTLSQKSMVMHQESLTTKKHTNVCPDWIPIYSKKRFMINHGYPTIGIVISDANAIPINGDASRLMTVKNSACCLYSYVIN